ncbi:MAG: PTS sugar transporter subunit IIA [Planctomycetota bacterium]
MQLTVRQAAELLSVSDSKIYHWIRERGLPAVLFDEQYRLNKVDLMVWAQSEGIAVRGEPEDGKKSLLAEALARGGIHRGLAAADRRQAVRLAVERISLPRDADREMILEVIEARQNLGTTAIGDGIAIPHARYPVVAESPEPVAGLCFLDKPLDFGAADGVLVHALFVLVTGSARAHLDLLAALARALSGPLRQAVRDRADPDAILRAAGGGT